MSSAFINYLSFTHPLIQQYLLSYFVPGTLLNTADTKMNKTVVVSALTELKFSQVERVGGVEQLITQLLTIIVTIIMVRLTKFGGSQGGLP